ncbi:hypothetical protein ACJDT4_17210 [Clostridium neuense]|uniref:SH3 domain-containing protein n=1 Tax=Clostridium neuense TaxID=1728934 RepID=A0ABW8TKX5_9CLOT
MFVFILFLIIVGTAAYFILTYSKKIEEQKRKIMVLARQNKKLKSEIKYKSQSYIEEQKLIVKYIYSDVSSGVVNCNAELYAAPTEEIFSLGKVMNGLSVEILDSCIVNNEKWYEIRFHSNQNINNKGWMKTEHITV